MLLNLLKDRFKLKVFLNLLTLFLSLYGISHQSWEIRESSLFDKWLIELIGPVQRLSFIAKESTTGFFNNYVWLINASKQNKELTKKIKEMENKIFELKEIGQENIRLKSLLQFGEEIPRQKILAQVVAWDAGVNYKVLRINKGSNHGIKLKSAVITADGLVGQVLRISNNFSDVLTILDHNIRVDGIVERTRTHGIIEGYSNFKCVMKYVTRTEPVVLDDLIISSGLGNIYPKGIRIGRITKIERETYGITQFIELTPIVDFSKLEEVVVLITNDNIDATENLTVPEGIESAVK